MRSTSPRRPLVALLIIGALLRLPWLASRPLWLDEALQHWISSAGTAGEVVRRVVQQDLNPPGFALLAHVALQLGDADVLLRLPSYVAGVVAIAVAWAAGRRWAGDRAAIGVAALVATCPPLVAWSREGRPYGVAVLAILGLLWAAGAHRARPSVRSAVVLTLAAGLAMPWHYGAWLVVGGILVGLATERRARTGAIVALGGAGVVGLGIAATVLAPQIQAADAPAHLARWTGPGAILGLPAAVGWLATGTRAFAVPVGLVGIVGLAIASRRIPPTLRAVALVPVGLVVLAAIVGGYPVGPVRHMLVLAPGLALLVGQARPIVVGGLAAGFLAATIATAPGVPVHDTPGQLARLADVRGAGELVWVHPLSSWPVRRYGVPAAPIVFGAWGEEPPDGAWVIGPAEVDGRRP